MAEAVCNFVWRRSPRASLSATLQGSAVSPCAISVFRGRRDLIRCQYSPRMPRFLTYTSDHRRHVTVLQVIGLVGRRYGTRTTSHPVQVSTCNERWAFVEG